MAIEITTYSPDLTEKYNEFVSKFWKRERSKSPEYLYWKFRGHYPDKLIGQVIALDNGNVIGISGNIHFEVFIDGKVYPSQWTFNHMVDVKYRGKGVAPLMHDEVIPRKPISFGSAPSPSASKSMARAGYKTMEGSWKVAFPKNFYEILKIKQIKLPFLKFIPNPFFYIPKLLSIFIESRFKPASESEYADLYHASKKPNEVYNLLTPDFLAWRFRPFIPFYAGLNIYKNSKGSYYAGFFNKGIYYIADFHAKSVYDFIDMMGHVFKQQGVSSIDVVRFMMNVPKHPKWMYLFGFLPFGTNTTIFYATKDPVILEALKNKRFYYSYLDSDENI
jgi:hypothetical protein